MRIGQPAAAAGTTPRAVRHYHRLGLLAEPPRSPNGYRDYTMADLARLMRIRWLADSGVPLGSVAAVLAADRGDLGTDEGTQGRTAHIPDSAGAIDDCVDASSADVRADIADLVTRSAERLAVAQRRHDRLVQMLEAAESGRTLSPLPADLVALLEAAHSECDDSERVAFLRDREFIEILAVAGRLPDIVVDWYCRTLGDPQSRKRYRAVMRDWDRLEGRAPGSVEREVTDLAARMADLMFEDPGFVTALGLGDLPKVSDVRIGDEVAVAELPAATLTAAEVIPDPAQREVIARVLSRLASGPMS